MKEIINLVISIGIATIISIIGEIFCPEIFSSIVRLATAIMLLITLIKISKLEYSQKNLWEEIGRLKNK